MNNDLISRSALKRKFRNVNEGMFQLSRVYELIDNAPIVDTYTEDDVQEAVKAGYQVGYELPKAKFERLQEVNCSHCDYWKFSRAIIHSFVDLMVAHGIESIEELEEELHRLNQSKQEEENND